jgi:hypothetical protein
MKCTDRLGGILAAVLLGASAAHAQEIPLHPPDSPATVGDQRPDPGADPPTPAAPQPRRSDLEAESLPAEVAQEAGRAPAAPPLVPPALGPAPVTEVRFLMDALGLARVLGDSGIEVFGWLEAGYTGVSGSGGLLSVQTRLNRFGDELVLSDMGLVIHRPLQQDQFDVGFKVRYFAGANPALGQPLGGIDFPPGNPRFSHDFRDIFLQAHLPILTEGGMNIRVGRMNTIIGNNGFIATSRPLFSNDYQFFYSTTGTFTGFLTQLVVNDRLDIWNGMTLGANTFFTKRSDDSYCYIGEVNYWLQEEKRTRLTVSVNCGPDALPAAPGLNGDFVSIVELSLVRNWSERFTQVFQSMIGSDANTPRGTGSWYGVYTQGVVHLSREWDTIFRADWFRDVKGTRTGIDTSYFEMTLGANWHPNKYLEVRPEVRGDFAGRPAFGAGGPRERSQCTAVMSALVKF